MDALCHGRVECSRFGPDITRRGNSSRPDMPGVRRLRHGVARIQELVHILGEPVLPGVLFVVVEKVAKAPVLGQLPDLPLVLG